MSQAVLFDTPPASPPAIGSRWRIATPRHATTYELEAVDTDYDPVYSYRLRCVEFESKWEQLSRVGNVIHVELAWFFVRSDVRAVGGEP